MKFDIQSKLNMIIMSIVLGIDDLDPELEICANLVPKLKYAPVFLKICHTGQI